MKSSYEQGPSLIYPAVECGLTVDQAISLRENAGGFLTIRQLHPQNIATSDYALGLNVSEYWLAVKKFSLNPWTKAYGDVQPSGPYGFMKAFTGQGRSAYLFVPRNVFTHERAGFTKDEMRWCIDNLDKINRIKFVFGLYDLSPRQIKNLASHNGFLPRIGLDILSRQ